MLLVQIVRKLLEYEITAQEIDQLELEVLTWVVQFER